MRIGVRLHVAGAMAVERRVRGVLVEVRGLDARDPCTSRGTPFTFATVFVQVLPPSRVTCTLPSSVPTQITFGFFGDSEMVMIVV